jgi:hypothetical protein
MSVSPERIINFNSDIIDLTNLLKLRFEIVKSLNEMRFKNYARDELIMIEDYFLKTLNQVDEVIKSIKG